MIRYRPRRAACLWNLPRKTGSRSVRPPLYFKSSTQQAKHWYSCSGKRVESTGSSSKEREPSKAGPRLGRSFSRCSPRTKANMKRMAAASTTMMRHPLGWGHKMIVKIIWILLPRNRNFSRLEVGTKTMVKIGSLIVTTIMKTRCPLW